MGLDTFIYLATGMKYTDARLKYVGEQVIELINDGVFMTISELASKFRGMSNNDIYSLLAGRNFPIGNDILKGLIAVASLKLIHQGTRWTSWQHILTAPRLVKELGLSIAANTLRRFIDREMNGQYIWSDELALPYLEYYARAVIRYMSRMDFVMSKEDFLRSLNIKTWDLSSKAMDSLIMGIFGVDYETAQELYKVSFLGNED